MMINRKKTEKGFTLVELMVASSIFIIIMTISMGSIISIFDANRKSRTFKTVLNNLNLAVESMSREMRFGTVYHCGSSGTLSDPKDCISGSSVMAFRSSSGDQITYSQVGSSIEKKVGNSAAQRVTAPEIVIDNLFFYVVGALPGDFKQPRVYIKIKGHAGQGESRTDFVLQTMVSQRNLDS